MAQTPPKLTGGIAHRTRQLSCILENWPESSSESYNSLLPPSSSAADDRTPNSMQSSLWENDDVDNVDETSSTDHQKHHQSSSNILEIDDLEESLMKDNYVSFYSQLNEIENKNTFFGNHVVQYPEVMITSCYGSIGDDGGDKLTEIVDRPIDLDLLYLNSIGLNNEPKCRSPLSVSLNASVCGEPSTMTDSIVPDAHECTNPLMEYSMNENEIEEVINGQQHLLDDGINCYSCQMPFDKGRKRRVVDNCGHGRCYNCLVTIESCPICIASEKDKEEENIQSADETDGKLFGKTKDSGKYALSAVDRASHTVSNARRRLLRLRQTQSNDSSDTSKPNRIRFSGSSASHLSSVVFGKIKSLWNAQTYTASSGLNQLADDECTAGSATSNSTNKSKSRNLHDELKVRLGQFLQSKSPRNGEAASGTSSCELLSENISPSSTMASSLMLDHVGFNVGPDFIGSMDSMQAPTNTNSIMGGSEVISSSQMQTSVVPLQLTLKPLFFEVPMDSHSTQDDTMFIGRHWLLRELSSLLIGQSSAHRGAILTGRPGTGKTAFILQLVKHSCFGPYNLDDSAVVMPEKDGIICQINVVHDRMRALASNVVAYHFCQVDNDVTCLVPDFVHSLAAQLCQAPQLEHYRNYVSVVPEMQQILSVDECITNPQRAIQLGILQPLSMLRRCGKITAKQCLILVDGLCEAEYHRPDYGDTIASFLAKIQDQIPAWLKFVVTVRTQMAQAIAPRSYTRISLDPEDQYDTDDGDDPMQYNLQKDIFDYVTHRINNSRILESHFSKDSSQQLLRFMQHLYGLSRGSFLFTKLTIDLIEQGYLVIKSASFNVLPVSLSQLFQLHFNLRFPTNCAYDKVFNILNVCLAALSPCTMLEIYSALTALSVNSNDGLMEWAEFKIRFNQLSGFLVRRLDGTFMFFHPSFREWLIRRDEGESYKFVCNLQVGHMALALRASRTGEQLDVNETVQLAHHILKANVFRGAVDGQSARDLQSYWLAATSNCLSACLAAHRNIFQPKLMISRLCLLAGASPNHCSTVLDGAQILSVAAHEGNVPLVGLLLEFGANVEAENAHGCTALMMAASNGHCDVVRQLVAAGCALGHPDKQAYTALVYAATTESVRNQPNIVRYLLSCDWPLRCGQKVYVPFEVACQQAFLAAAQHGHVMHLEDFYESDAIDMNATNGDGMTALMLAAQNGHADAVAFLLGHGAICSPNSTKETPLLLAAGQGHMSVCEILLQHNVNVDERNAVDGKTALIAAASGGFVEIVNGLITSGAAVDISDVVEGWTALSWACAKNQLNAVRILIDNNADVGHLDKRKRTPLEVAIEMESISVVRWMIDLAFPAKCSSMNLLDRSIGSGNSEMVQIMLQKGVKLGSNAWVLAAGKPEIILIILNKLLEDGNVLYRRQNLQAAGQRYQYILNRILGQSIADSAVEHFNIFLQLRINCLLNLSRCLRKQNKFAEAIEIASQSIELAAHSFEGYYARSKALLGVHNIHDALQDINKAVEMASDVAADVKIYLKRFQQDLQRKSNEIAGRRCNPMDLITDL